jgi:hypothetical protein
MPKEGFEPLPDPRQSLARAQLTTKEDLLRQSFGKVHKAFALRVDFDYLHSYAVGNVDAVVLGDVMDGLRR